MSDLNDRLAALTPEQRALFESRLRERGLAAPRARSIRPIPGRDRLEHLPTSLDQERLWFLDQMEPGHAAYNIPMASRLFGPLDPELMRRAVNASIARHEVLRTTFRAIDGRPVQVVAPTLEIDVPLLDLTHLPEPDREAAAMEFAFRTVSEGFDLARGPLVRVRLARVKPDEHVMAFTMHHIVTDRFSFDLFENEVSRIYVALRDGRDPELPELPIQFADFAAWQREEMSGDRLERHLEYWRGAMAKAPLVFEIPPDRPRPPIQTFAGAREYIVYPDSSLTALKNLARAEGTTMFMTVLAALDVLCWKWSGQRDFIIGSAIADRNRPETEHLIGYFLNMLLLRARIDPAMSFRQLLRQARETALGAFAHQDVPFATLVAELKPRPDPSRNPLMQVSYIYLDFPDYATAEHAGLTPASLDVDNRAARFDMTLACTESPGTGIQAYFEYCTDLYEPATAQRLLRQLGRIFEEVTSAPDRPLREIDARTDEERAEQAAFNATERRFEESSLTLHALVERAAAAAPDARLVIDGSARHLDGGRDATTLVELDAAAGRLARRIAALAPFPPPPPPLARVMRGIPRGDGETAGPHAFRPGDRLQPLVAVFAERSREQAIALLAVLKSGAAYVPLDPTLPAARLEAILGEARPAAVLVTRALADAMPATDVPIVVIEDALRDEDAWRAEDVLRARDDSEASHADQPEHGVQRTHPDDLAYVMFTSGSTGVPKGVMVSHRAIVNRILWAQERYPLRPDDRVLHNASFAFDIAAWELFGPLAVGASVIVPREGEHKDPAALARLIAEERVTVAHFVPAMLREILEEPRFRDGSRALRAVFCGGEGMEHDLHDRFFEILPGRTLAHFYGPTEAAISCLFHDCAPTLDPGPVPIGRPISNMSVHLLDEALRPVPVGVAGEIAIGGDGLARGYLGRPDLTAERFVPDPVSGRPGARLYRTGDLARFHPDGGITFLGRTDDQLKIRGYRIEPAEIERALERVPGIARAVAVARGEGSARRLVAYILPDSERASSESLQEAGTTASEPRPARPDHREGEEPHARKDESGSAGRPLDETALRAALRRTLPEPMIPAAFVTLEALPLGPNGKVDRRALPDPGIAAAGPGAFTPPRTPAEETIAAIWAVLLRRERVGAFESFFDLGGDSLLATQVVSRVRSAFEIDLPLRRFFEGGSTVASLAAIVEEILVETLAAMPEEEAVRRLAEDGASATEDDARAIPDGRGPRAAKDDPRPVPQAAQQHDGEDGPRAGAQRPGSGGGE